MSFIKYGVGLPPQDGQQSKWQKQVVEKLEYLKYELWTFAAYVFPNALQACGTIVTAQERHHSCSLKRVNARRR